LAAEASPQTDSENREFISSQTLYFEGTPLYDTKRETVFWPGGEGEKEKKFDP